MPTKPFPIIRDSLYGQPPINFWPAKDDSRGMVLHGSPGLLSVVTLPSCTEVRELYAWEPYLYALARRGSDSVLWKIEPSAGTAVELGYFSTSFSGPAWMRNNIRSDGSSQLAVCDGTTIYLYTPSTNKFAVVSDADLTGATAIDYQDTYLLYVLPNSQTWGISNANDFANYYADDLFVKEGSTDNIVSILSDGVNVYIFGAQTMEPWYDTGGANTTTQNATFQRNQGGVFRYGCAAPKTPCNFDNTPAWLSDRGEWLRFSGNVPQIISPDMFSRDIKNMALFTDANAFVYKDEGHVFMQVNFPTGDMSWVVDAKTGMFHKRLSYKASDEDWGRHRANCYAYLETTKKHYVGDFENGKIYEMSSNYYDDDGHPIPGILTSQEIDNGFHFMSFPPVQLMMESGVGLASGLDPQAVLEISNDGGKTWQGDIGWQSMGKIGDYNYQSIWWQGGGDYRRMYRWTITDAVKRKILGVDWGFK